MCILYCPKGVDPTADEVWMDQVEQAKQWNTLFHVCSSLLQFLLAPAEHTVIMY